MNEDDFPLDKLSYNFKSFEDILSCIKMQFRLGYGSLGRNEAMILKKKWALRPIIKKWWKGKVYLLLGAEIG